MDVRCRIFRPGLLVVYGKAFGMSRGGIKAAGEGDKNVFGALDIVGKVARDLLDNLLTSRASGTGGEGMGCHYEVQQNPDLKARPGDDCLQAALLAFSALLDLRQSMSKAWMTIAIEDAESPVIVIFA